METWRGLNTNNGSTNRDAGGCSFYQYVVIFYPSFMQNCPSYIDQSNLMTGLPFGTNTIILKLMAPYADSPLCRGTLSTYFEFTDWQRL